MKLISETIDFGVPSSTVTTSQSGWEKGVKDGDQRHAFLVFSWMCPGQYSQSPKTKQNLYNYRVSEFDTSSGVSFCIQKSENFGKGSNSAACMEEKSERRTKMKELAHYPLRSNFPSPAPEAKLSTVTASLDIQLRSADMPAAMQERAFRYTAALLSAATTHAQRKPTSIAFAIKKEFDAAYGLAWHCVVGESFGSFVTHSRGGFLYFSVGNLSFLLFKTAVRPIADSGH